MSAISIFDDTSCPLLMIDGFIGAWNLLQKWIQHSFVDIIVCRQVAIKHLSLSIFNLCFAGRTSKAEMAEQLRLKYGSRKHFGSLNNLIFYLTEILVALSIYNAP